MPGHALQLDAHPGSDGLGMSLAGPAGARVTGAFPDRVKARSVAANTAMLSAILAVRASSRAPAEVDFASSKDSLGHFLGQHALASGQVDDHPRRPRWEAVTMAVAASIRADSNSKIPVGNRTLTFRDIQTPLRGVVGDRWPFVLIHEDTTSFCEMAHLYYNLHRKKG